MDAVTLVSIAMIAPLAIGMVATLIAGRNAGHVKKTFLTTEEFEAAFDAYYEYVHSEEYFDKYIAGRD